MSYAQKLRLPRRTTGRRGGRRKRVRKSYLLDPSHFSSYPVVSPVLLRPASRFFPRPPSRLRRLLRLRSYEDGSPCFCFDNIFSRIGRGRILLLASTMLRSPPPPILGSSVSAASIPSASGNPRNLLLGISWIIINAYAVAGGIERPAVLLLLFCPAPFFPTPSHHPPSLPSAGFRYVRIGGTTARTTTAA